MECKISPKIKRLGLATAYLYDGDEVIALATHETCEDGFGGSRPAEDIMFDNFQKACKPTHAKICGKMKKLGSRMKAALLPGDSYTINLMFEIEAFSRPWTEEPLE